MKFFGSYLVDQGIINEMQLVAALVEQVKSTPSVSEVIFDKQLLEPKQQLMAFEYYSQNRTTYTKALEDLGFWSEAIASALKDTVLRCRRPIGQVLVMQKSVEFAELTKALDEFVLEAEDQIEQPPVVATVAAVSPESVADTDVAKKPISVFDFQFREFDKSLLNEYFELITEAKHKHFEGIAQSLGKASDDYGTKVGELANEFNAVKAGARFIMATVSEYVLEHIGKLLSVIHSEPELASGREKEFGDLCLSTIKLVWSLKDRIEMHHSERAFWDDPEAQGQYRQLCEEIGNFHKAMVAKDAA